MHYSINDALKTYHILHQKYQCSECDHCSQNLEEATLHAVQAHGEDKDDIQEDTDSDEDYDDKVICADSSDDEIESNSIFTSYRPNSPNGPGSSSGTRKSELWPVEATKILLNCVSEFYSDLINRIRKRKDIWGDIHKVVSKTLPEITPNQCEQKWRNLLSAQRKYLLTVNVYGKKSGIKKPDFCDDVSMIVGTECNTVEKSNDYSIQRANRSYKSLRMKERKSRENDSLTSALKSLLKKEEPNINIPTSDAGVLIRLVSTLEKRESSNRVFQKEIIAIEREKLACIQRFIENKERQNARRLDILKEYMYGQKSKKRRFDMD